MGNTVASGQGYSLEVGKNCEKFYEFKSDIVLTFKNLYITKIKYNNSKYGNACLAATQTIKGIILAQNKNFNYQWEITQNEDTGASFIIGNHTRRCEKNSLAIFEVMEIDPTVLQANHSKISAVARKFKNDSELASQIKSLCK
jgi:hypothetical protein